MQQFGGNRSFFPNPIPAFAVAPCGLPQLLPGDEAQLLKRIVPAMRFRAIFLKF
jgi:hypothetical protein